MRTVLTDLAEVRHVFVHAAPAAGPDAGRPWVEIELHDRAGGVVVVIVKSAAEGDMVRVSGKVARDWHRGAAEAALADGGPA